jgi:hypothetical protein
MEVGKGERKGGKGKKEREKRGYLLAHPNSVSASLQSADTIPFGMAEI